MNIFTLKLWLKILDRSLELHVLLQLIWQYNWLTVIHFNISFCFFVLFIYFYFIFILFFLSFSLLSSHVQENKNIAIRSRYNFNLSPSIIARPCQPVVRVHPLILSSSEENQAKPSQIYLLSFLFVHYPLYNFSLLSYNIFIRELLRKFWA